MKTPNDKRLVFGAMALFFFVFLESTLFFQTSLGMIVGSAAGSLLQFPIQGASALGLLLFSALNRKTDASSPTPSLAGSSTIFHRAPPRQHW